MASADLRADLECSLCLNFFTDPVNLECGHSFCRDCIDGVLEAEEDMDYYRCPQCRNRFYGRPALHKNLTLRNIVESFTSTQQENKTSCTYCIHSLVPAVKSCLHCEASLCDNHLKVHSKSPEHVLSEPTAFLESRKCPVHKKVLEYYCTEDAACLCVSCTLEEEHRGHQVKALKQAAIGKKRKLKRVLQKLTEKEYEIEKRVSSLQEHGKEVEGKGADEAQRITRLIADIRRQLKEQEKRVLSEITGQAQRVSLSVSDTVRQLELEKEKVSRRTHRVKELCNTADSVTVLQESDLSDTNEGADEEDMGMDKKQVKGVGDLDVTLLSHALDKLSSMVRELKGGVFTQEAEDLTLDIDTANNELVLSEDRKTVHKSLYQNRPETSKRFLWYPQVLSSQRFYSGRHYWDVDVRSSHNWKIGVSYPSIARRIDYSIFGHNLKSWGLYRSGNWYSVIYNKKRIRLPDYGSISRVRIYLDYEAGQISFCKMGDPIEHLHTFTATFTEPLHAAICVWRGSVSVKDWDL